jgi:tetratricopeptide (TPR) repeat protein
LNFEGNYLVARALAEQIGREFSSEAEHPWPSADDCARRLGWNDATRRKAEMEILSRLNDPPFKEQANNREQYQHMLQQIERLQSATLPEALREDKARTKAAADHAPNDWILQENLAYLQQQTGDASGALESCRHVTGLMPHNPDAWETLGLGLVAVKRDDEAISAFQEANRLRPESVVAGNSLGELYVREGRTDDAAREFRQVLRLKPYWGPAHLGLGKVLEAAGKTQEANEQFEEALKNRINSPESFNALAKFSFQKGLQAPAAAANPLDSPAASPGRFSPAWWFAAATTNFSDSLRLYPADPETQVNLGLTLAKLGRRAEAKARYVEAMRLQPNFAEAHFCLGLELGQDNDAAGAAAQFAEAVRLKPELIEARLNLGIALSNQHLNQQALDQFDAVLRQDARNPIALKYAQTLRGAHVATPQNQ